MSDADFEEIDQDDNQLRLRILEFNRKKQPFRFIGDINLKIEED